MKSWRSWAGALLVGGLVALLGACGDRAAPVRVGFVAELSGHSAELGESGRNGFMLAMEEARQQGLFGARPIEVMVRDVNAPPETTRRLVAELIEAKVEAIAGPTTSAMVDVIQPVTEAAGVVLVSPTASAVKFLGKDDLLFRANWTTRDDSRSYAEHYYNKGLHSVAIAVNVDNRPFSESWLAEFTRAFTALGGQVLAVSHFESATASYAQMAKELLAPRPAAVLFIATAVDSARLAQQVHKLAPGTPMIAAEWAGASQLFELGGKAVEGLYLGLNFNPFDPSPRYRAFHAAYLRRYGKEPNYAAVFSYDTGVAITQALAKRPTGMPMKDALRRFGPYPALQQSLSFDTYGDAQRTIYFMVVRDGRFVPE